jgi:hypothetical protein
LFLSVLPYFIFFSSVIASGISFTTKASLPKEPSERMMALITIYCVAYFSKVRSMNVHLEQALMGRGASHIGVIDTNCIVRKEYTTHGQHLNSRGKRKLTLLIAGSLGGDHVSGISSIPVITHPIFETS